MKYLFCDTETTGVDPRKHTMWEISYLILDDERLENYNKESFNQISTLYLEPGNEWEPQAEKMYQEALPYILENPMPSHIAYDTFVETLDHSVSKYDKKDKLTFVGYNAKFDWDFIYTWMKEIHGNKYTGSYLFFPPIDIAQECAMVLGDKRANFPDFKLSTVAKLFDIEVNESMLHNAFYDVHLSILLFKKAIERRYEDAVTSYLESMQELGN